MRTAGRTVLFSAVTVAAAMFSLIVFHLRFLYSMAYGGALVALTAALVSLTVLPALLAVLGPRVNALALKRWQVAIQRDAAHVRARPLVPVLAVGDAPARPDRDRHVGAADRARAAVPADRVHRRRRRACCRATARRAWSRTRSTPSSPPGRTAPIYAVARTGRRGARCGATRGGSARRRDVAVPPRPVRLGDVWRIDVVTEAPSLSDPAKRLVDDVRATCRAPFPHRVGGGDRGVRRPAGVAAPLAAARRSRCCARRRW